MNKVTLLIRSSLRVFRHLFVDRDYRRYYSAESWERTWRDEFPDFSGAKEDAHCGAMLQILRRYDGGSLLDLGCGDGSLWKYYRPLSDSLLVGVDYSATAVKNANARALPNCRFHCADFRNYTPDNRFSAVVFNESIYYIDDIAGAIRRAESWLDDQGVLVLCMIDTLVTKRVWRRISAGRRTLQACRVRDLGTGRSRTIRVLAPSQP